MQDNVITIRINYNNVQINAFKCDTKNSHPKESINLRIVNVNGNMNVTRYKFNISCFMQHSSNQQTLTLQIYESFENEEKKI